MWLSRRASFIAVALTGAACVPSSGCRSRGNVTDFLDSAASAARLEAVVAGRDAAWVGPQTGKHVWINDVAFRTLPASPPSTIRYKVRIPRGARLTFACGIPEARQDRPGVEFVVKVRRNDSEDAVFTELIDPLRRPEHRTWQHRSVDLAKYAGDAEITFETRGYASEERDADGRYAYWGAPALTLPAGTAPLVIVYLVDTLRADHTSAYGYARDTTPRLNEFAKDAVLFETAISQASWTKPAVASLFTSLLPGRHRAVQLRDALDLGHVTIAEMLAAKGYATGAAIANSVIYSPGSNFEQGFDYFAGMHGEGNRPSKLVGAAKVVDGGLEWLEERRGMPTFLYVHTMDPHVPYQPPPPFDRMFEPHPAPGHPGADPRTDYTEPADRDRLIAQYDGDVAYGDQEFGRFVTRLRERGLYDQATIVFLGDHGEEFLDHGKWLHGRSVFDELVRVPLLVKFPGNRGGGKRVKQMVQVVDVVPTILAQEGLPVPNPPVIAGRPLQKVVAGGAPEPPAVSEISHRGNVAFGMRTAQDKYIRRFAPEEDELYFDLVDDPKEVANRFDPGSERVRMLKAGVEAAMVPNPFRHNMRVTGPGRYELRLRTGGWVEGVEAAGLGSGERYSVEANGRRLSLSLAPGAGKERLIAFGVRPIGAPVWVEGTKDGRPLAAGEVFIAEEGVHPAAMPFKFPEIESSSENENERFYNVLAPPRGAHHGISLWLAAQSGKRYLELDKETRERLKALGYLGPG